MNIRNVTKLDAPAYWKLRLRALNEHPESFGASYDEAIQTPIEQVIDRIYDTIDNYILGAFDNEKIVGMVGFRREQSQKARHKGFIWGMYCNKEVQGQGIGRALLLEVVDRSKKLAGLEQLLLSVVTNNLSARSLYTNIGFKPYGYEKNALKISDKYLDEEHMVLFLH